LNDLYNKKRNKSEIIHLIRHKKADFFIKKLKERKKVKKIMVGVIALVLVASPVWAKKPDQAQGPSEKVTGEFTAYAGGAGLTMKINAHNAETLKGEVSYSNTLGAKYILFPNGLNMPSE